MAFFHMVLIGTLPMERVMLNKRDKGLDKTEATFFRKKAGLSPVFGTQCFSVLPGPEKRQRALCENHPFEL